MWRRSSNTSWMRRGTRNRNSGNGSSGQAGRDRQDLDDNFGVASSSRGDMTSRREFLERAVLSSLAASLPVSGMSESGQRTSASTPARGFLDLHRPPDSVIVQ